MAAARELAEEAGYRGSPLYEPVAWYVAEEKQEDVACVLVRRAHHVGPAPVGRDPTWIAVSRARNLLKENRSEKEAEAMAFVLDEALEMLMIQEVNDADTDALR